MQKEDLILKAIEELSEGQKDLKRDVEVVRKDLSCFRDNFNIFRIKLTFGLQWIVFSFFTETVAAILVRYFS